MIVITIKNLNKEYSGKKTHLFLIKLINGHNGNDYCNPMSYKTNDAYKYVFVYP